MQELDINSTVQITLLLFIPLLFAFILKQTGIRSWAMLGGVVGGVLLGPTVFGAVAPENWESVFQGGTVAHEKLIQLERQQHADILAATTLGVDETSILQMKADHHYVLLQKVDAWNTEKWNAQSTIRWYTMVLIVFVLLSGSMRCKAKGTAPPAGPPLSQAGLQP
jgi:hypothetical protein